jgi:hypothetical protein
MGSIKEYRRRHGDIRGSRNSTLILPPTINKLTMLLTICETLKTRVKLNLNFTRPHAITYTNVDGNIRNVFLIRSFCKIFP